MSSRDWHRLAAAGALVVATLVASVAVGMFVWTATSPQEPSIAARRSEAGSDRSHVPGGVLCSPGSIAALPSDERGAEVDRCAQAWETHRVEQLQIGEAVRANDIAEWNLRLAYRQARASAVQAVASVLAFIAAAVAAFIAWRTVVWARNALYAQRAHMVHQGFTTRSDWGEEGAQNAVGSLLGVHVACEWVNASPTPALLTRMFVEAMRTEDGQADLPDDYDFAPQVEVASVHVRAGLGVPVKDSGELIPATWIGAAKEGRIRIFVSCQLTYSDVFEPRRDRHTDIVYEAIPLLWPDEITKDSKPPFFHWRSYRSDRYQRAD